MKGGLKLYNLSISLKNVLIVMQKKILFIWLIIYRVTGKAKGTTSSFTFSGYLEYLLLMQF